MNSPERNQAKEEAKKKRYLVVGVWVFSIVILMLWLNTLRLSFQSDVFSVSPRAREAWQEDLDESMSYFQNNLNLLNEASQSNENSKNSEISIDGQVFLQDMADSLSEQQIKKEVVSQDFQELEMLKIESNNLLKTLENKININSSCPVFINCMPGPDRVEPCSIPPGCEDITQIAY
jgi:hypothetical protein